MRLCSELLELPCKQLLPLIKCKNEAACVLSIVVHCLHLDSCTKSLQSACNQQRQLEEYKDQCEISGDRYLRTVALILSQCIASVKQRMGIHAVVFTELLGHFNGIRMSMKQFADQNLSLASELLLAGYQELSDAKRKISDLENDICMRMSALLKLGSDKSCSEFSSNWTENIIHVESENTIHSVNTSGSHSHKKRRNNDSDDTSSSSREKDPTSGNGDTPPAFTISNLPSSSAVMVHTVAARATPLKQTHIHSTASSQTACSSTEKAAGGSSSEKAAVIVTVTGTGSLTGAMTGARVPAISDARRLTVTDGPSSTPFLSLVHYPLTTVHGLSDADNCSGNSPEKLTQRTAGSADDSSQEIDIRGLRSQS